MFRTICLVSLLGIGAVAAQQSPTPIADQGAVPIPAPPKLYATQCACAVYPVYDDGDSVLYYAELCDPATACTVNDAGYYWSTDLDWPLECNTSGNPGSCDYCDQISLVRKRGAKTQEIDVPGAFPGMKAKKNKADTAKDQLIPAQVKWTNDSGSNVSLPRAGVAAEYSNGFYVSFKYGREMIYAKLLMVRVKPANVNAPEKVSRERILFIGYEVGDLSQTEKDNAFPVDYSRAIRRKLSGPDPESDFAVTVKIGKSAFLVLLANGS